MDKILHLEVTQEDIDKGIEECKRASVVYLDKCAIAQTFIRNKIPFLKVYNNGVMVRGEDGEIQRWYAEGMSNFIETFDNYILPSMNRINTPDKPRPTSFVFKRMNLEA